MNGGALQFLRGEWKVQEKALFWQVHDIWRPWTETLIDERALSRCTHTLSPSFSLHRPVKQCYVVEPLHLLSLTHSLYLSWLSVSNTLSPWQVEACLLIYPVTPSVKNPFKKFMIFPHTLLSVAVDWVDSWCVLSCNGLSTAPWQVVLHISLVVGILFSFCVSSSHRHIAGLCVHTERDRSIPCHLGHLLTYSLLLTNRFYCGWQVCCGC